MSARLLILSLLAACALPVQAFDPALSTVMPRGGQTGTTVAVVLSGDRLIDPEEIVFYRPGITVSDLQHESPKRLKANFQISPDAAPGEYPFRLRTKSGVSYLRTFWVNPFASIEEDSVYDQKRKHTNENNDTFEEPQRIELDSVIHGTARREDADYYVFSGKKGQRVTAEVFGMRLGRVLFDPYLALLDAKRFEIATCDDTVLTRRDPFLSVVLPEDGDYTLLIRESSYQGGDNSNYLLQVSTSPRPTSVHPPVGQLGQKMQVTFRGDAAGESSQEVTLPSEKGTHPLFASVAGKLAPSPNPILVTNHPILAEKEPNNHPRELSGESVSLPVALHGVISEPKDMDWFLFSAKKGQQVRVQVRARQLRSPLDPWIQVRSVKDNKALGNADDDGNFPDSKMDLKIPADGDYRLLIRDHLQRGGPDFTYVVEISSRQPSLKAELPYGENNNSQKHRAIVIPRGNHLAIVPNVVRQNTNCDVILKHDQLPSGVSAESEPAPRSPANFPILFSAAKNAPLSSTLTTFRIQDTKSDLSGPFLENIHHIEVNNAGAFCSTRSERLLVAVIEEAPFHLAISQPAVPLVRNGTMDLRVKATRKKDFTAPIKVTVPWRPPGVGAPPEVTIPEGKSEATISINANGEAPLRSWSLCVTGEAKTKSGNVRVSSPFVKLSLAEPYLAGSIDLTTTQQGNNVTLVCELENLTPFEGEAQLTLHSLPHKVTAPAVKIQASDQKVEIPLTIPPDVRPGKNKNIFAQVLVKKGKDVIPHQIAQGSTLVITPPPKKEEKEKPSSKPIGES